MFVKFVLERTCEVSGGEKAKNDVLDDHLSWNGSGACV